MKTYRCICYCASKLFYSLSCIILIFITGVDSGSVVYIFNLLLFGCIFFALGKLFSCPDNILAVIVSIDFCLKAVVGEATRGRIFPEHRIYIRNRSILKLFRKCMETFNNTDLREMVLEDNFTSKKVSHTNVFTL